MLTVNQPAHRRGDFTPDASLLTRLPGIDADAHATVRIVALVRA